MAPRWLARLLALAAALPAAAAPPARLSVEGTEFVLYRLDGRVLRSAELIGAELDLGGGRQLRIDAVRPDPSDPSGTVLLHRFSQRERGGAWAPACEADREGRQEGFPVPGRWVDGRYQPGRDHFALSCTAGAQAKCVRWGYRPWAPAPDGTPMAPMYEACVHMVRADYCGDGTATTRDGTAIDIYDGHGVQQPANEAGFRFEAGWAPHGAVCVNHARVPQNLKLEDLAQRCPRLKDALGRRCDEASARAAGALLFNRSK
ncbi:ADYC domain-containing protein [Tahibacter harae]|uniref:ADYC domain-containing protein n=1 Tax=Tahibacter harae TaxID=2963937 RepID=A0ABT1QUA4_9GAMM|nr:ADYC domain-containing protein [Tahibacter harae]MCQ4165852.1 ADYC domain-containing protein [Tahibacter harae]